MAYLTLDDGSGSIELLAFQQVIDESGGYMQVNTPVIAAGRLSARDEKEPQIVVNTLRPITDVVNAAYGMRNEGSGREGTPLLRQNIGTGKFEADNGIQGRTENKTLFVKIQNEGSAEYERLKLIHMMFPGRARMVIHFCDTNKSVGATCVIHEALVSELREMLGAGNVVVR
jgi:DNA polymerase-3 subunit alpha